MSLSLLARNNTILEVSDEALYIFACSAKKGPHLVEVVNWDADNFENNVATIIAKDCGGKPVIIVNDMVEQHYRKERVMRSGVGMMDKSSMLKRKLAIAFPNYPVRAAFKLKEKVEKTEKKGAADVYIFAAIPESPQFKKTLSAVNKSLASISSFCLLPVEACDMIKTLSAKLRKKGETKAKWVVLVGQHRNGNLRQIVVKNGELALTRMTPVGDADADPEGWASEVHQEFNATMSYLTRFGFVPEEGLHVIAIAGQAAGEALHPLMDSSFMFSALNAAEAAKVLSLPFPDQDGVRYADGLHAIWISRKTSMILPMKSHQVDQISRPRQMAMAAIAALVLVTVFLGYQLVNVIAQVATTNSALSEQKNQLNQLNVEYQKEVQRKEALGFDVRLVQSSIAVFDSLELNKIQPLSLFKSLGIALGKDMRIDKITIGLPEKNALSVLSTGQPAKPPVFIASMQMTYPSTADVEKGNQEVKDLAATLQKLLKDHTVEVTKLLKDYEYSESMVVATGDLQKRDVNQDFVAEISIKGPPMADPPVAP